LSFPDGWRKSLYGSIKTTAVWGGGDILDGEFGLRVMNLLNEV
jgi:hypothetical protein